MLAAVLRPDSAVAAWDFVPALTLEAETNDNPRLLPESAALGVEPGDPATRLLLEAGALITSYGARGEFFMEPAARTDAYSQQEHEDLQSTDAFFASGGEYRWERSRAGFDADLSSERILGSEFLSLQDLDPLVDDVTLTDTLLLAENERRKRLLFSSFLEFDPNVNGSVRLDGRFMNVRYDSDAGSRRTDFKDFQIGSTYTHRLGNRSSVSGTAYVAAFEAEANQNTTRSAGLELVYARDISEIWAIDLALGGVRSEVDAASFPGFVDDQLGAPTTFDEATLLLGLRRRSERSRLVLDIGRDLNPDSFGFLVARNQLRFILAQQLSATVEGRVALRAINTESIDTQLREDRNYGRLDLSVAWSFAELWAFTASYALSSRDVVSSAFDSGDATSNSVSIGLSYRGRQRVR